MEFRVIGGAFEMEALSPAYTDESESGLNRKLRIEDHHLAGFPVGRTHSARLKSLQNSKSLIRASTDIEIIDHCVLQYSIRVNNEKSPERNSFVFYQNSVFTRDLF